MIRIIDSRSDNHESQISEHNSYPQDVYIRIRNPIETVGKSPPPLQTDNNNNNNNRAFVQHQNPDGPRNNNDSNINVNENFPSNPKHVDFHVDTSINPSERNDQSLHDSTQKLSEIQQEQNQRRSTVLRHSSTVTREEVYIDRCRRIHEELSRPADVQTTSDTRLPEDTIKVLKPEEINENHHNVKPGLQFEQHDQNRLTAEKYHMLKKQLLSKDPITNRVHNPQFRAFNRKDTKEAVNEEESIHRFIDDSIIFSEKFSVDPSYHPYAITSELTDAAEGYFSREDLTLRYQVIVFLWILLGERRLLRTGYPSASIHLVLWRVVHICCSVAGVKTAAAVPLPDYHNCGADMLCFRDHVHRFLEVCAPTRDLWKQFGWASLTVDAVMRKIYNEELLPVLLQHTVAIPTPIRMAMRKLATMEREENARRNEHTFQRNNPKLVRVARQGSASPHRLNTPVNFRHILPKPQEKKKRGRPIKIKKILPDAGRIQRVMLWRFIMNLLEEPGNEDCIHWVKRDEGIFRILNTDWLARIWGRRHGNPRMTYEKMARAMRTYYRSKVLQPVPRARNLPRKLVYKFNPALVKKIPVHKESHLD